MKRTLTKICAVASAMALFATIAPNADAANPEAVTLNATVNAALIFSVDANTVNLDVDPTTDNGQDSAHNVFTVNTNNDTGYTISVRFQDVAGGSGTGASQLADGSGNTIASGNALTTENVLGYVAYNSETTSKDWAALSTDSTDTAVAFTNADSTMTIAGGGNVGVDGETNEQKHTVYYLLNVDYNSVPGAYAGTVTYTAIPAA